MSLWTGSGAVMAAKRFVNFVQGGNALSARLSIPEHDETLPADTAVGFSVPVCGFAEYLHFGTSKEAEAILNP